VDSRSDVVYLSTCYPIHFAINAAGDDDDLLVVELPVANLLSEALVADEDALAYCLDDPATTGMPFIERARHYRKTLHLYPASLSLEHLGTCAHLGPIDPKSISRIARVPRDQIKYLIIGGFDSTVSKAHFEIFGDEYSASMPWLFGDLTACPLNPKLPLLPIDVLVL